jgi:putative transposase
MMPHLGGSAVLGSPQVKQLPFNSLKSKGHIAAKAVTSASAKNSAYTSQLLAYRDEFVFTDCSIREYWDDIEKLLVDRDINAAINIKKVGLSAFPTIKRPKGSAVIASSTTDATSKEILHILRREAPRGANGMFEKRTPTR